MIDIWTARRPVARIQLEASNWNMRRQDDDYADLVGAGFAILCSALLLVAFFLFALPKLEHTNVAPQERPGAASPLMSSNAHSS
jgi:hypothetical protein